MSLSKCSTTEKIPLSIRMKIPKEKLLIESQKEEWQITSEKYSVKEFPGLLYCVGIFSRNYNGERNYYGKCVFLVLHLIMESYLKMNVYCRRLCVPSANYNGIYSEGINEDGHLFYTYIGNIDELFDPTNNFFVDDSLIITMEAILTIHLEKLNDVVFNDGCKCKLGLKLWDRNDKNLTFVVEGKEIKVHKLVIETKSHEWKNMIQTELKESEDAKIAIDDFDFETVETALKFCYGIEERHFWSVESAIEVLCFADKYQISDLKTSMENFLSFQLAPMNVCRIANASIYTNSFKLCHLCFEYLLECNQNKIFVADLKLLHEDFSAELMEAIFSQSPSLEKMESTAENNQENVQQFQNPVPQNRTPFLKNVFSITAFMVLACSLIAAFFSPKFKSYYQSINQIWPVILHLSIQMLWWGGSIAFARFRNLLLRTPFKSIGLLFFTVFSGFMLSAYIGNYDEHHILNAFGLTSMASILLITFASFTRYDFTNVCTCPYFFVLYLFAAVFSCIALVIQYLYPTYLFVFSWIHLCHCILCTLLLMFTLMKHFQNILGNNMNVINENEFCYASIKLFTIILQIFMFILGGVATGDGSNILFVFLSISLTMF